VRVLVTGSNGLIGRHAVAALTAAGHTVIALGRSPSPRASSFLAADLLDERQMLAAVDAARAEALLHLAWVTEHGRFWRASENLDWLAASLRLARRFVEGGGARIVTAGTCAEYDWRRLPDDGICREAETPLASPFLYGVAKDALRRTLEAYAAEAGVSYAHGRVFFVYGEGEAPGRLVPSVIRALRAGEVPKTTEGRQIRDFVSSSDLGAAFAALVTSEVQGAVNMGSGVGVALRELIAILRNLIGGEVAYGALPTSPDDPPRLIADARRLREEVGYAGFTPLERGLAELVERSR
jgi:nucleoside-diphosphate-sugar epimerase